MLLKSYTDHLVLHAPRLAQPYIYPLQESTRKIHLCTWISGLTQQQKYYCLSTYSLLLQNNSVVEGPAISWGMINKLVAHKQQDGDRVGDSWKCIHTKLMNLFTKTLTSFGWKPTLQQQVYIAGFFVLDYMSGLLGFHFWNGTQFWSFPYARVDFSICFSCHNLSPHWWGSHPCICSSLPKWYWTIWRFSIIMIHEKPCRSRTHPFVHRHHLTVLTCNVVLEEGIHQPLAEGFI